MVKIVFKYPSGLYETIVKARSFWKTIININSVYMIMFSASVLYLNILKLLYRHKVRERAIL